jgi:sugar lactone lactonase YvrE
MTGSQGGSDSASDVAYGPDGHVYVLFGGQSEVQVFTLEGVFLRRWGGRCAQWQPSCLSSPVGLTVAPGGFVYVADSSAIKVYSWWGAYLGQWGSLGAGAGMFKSPRAVVVGPNGLIYVSDVGNNRIQVFRYNAPAPLWLPRLLR